MTLEEKKDLVKLGIKRILTGEVEEVRIPMMGISIIQDIMEEHQLYHEPSEYGDTNGWEIDFWFKFKGRKTIGVSGSVWGSKDTYKMYLDEEDTTEEGE